MGGRHPFQLHLWIRVLVLGLLSSVALAEKTETKPQPKFDPVAAYKAKYGKKPAVEFDWSTIKKPLTDDTAVGEDASTTTGEGEPVTGVPATKPYTKDQIVEWLAAQDSVAFTKENFLLQQQAQAAAGPVDTSAYMKDWALKEYGTGPTGVGGTPHGGSLATDLGTSAYPVKKDVAALFAEAGTGTTFTKPVSALTAPGTEPTAAAAAPAAPTTPVAAETTPVASSTSPATTAPVAVQETASTRAPAVTAAAPAAPVAVEVAPTAAEVLGEGAEMVYRAGGGSGYGSGAGSAFAGSADSGANSAFPGDGGGDSKAFWDYSNNSVAYERRVRPMELEAPEVPTPDRLPDAVVPTTREAVAAVPGAPAAEASQPAVPPQVERALENALQTAQDPASSPQQVAEALNVLVQINNIFEVPGSKPSAELREAAALVNQILGGDAPKGTDVLVARAPTAAEAEVGGMGRLIAARTGVPMDEFDIFLKGQKGGAAGGKGDVAAASASPTPAVGKIGPLLEPGKLKELKVPAAGGKLTAEAPSWAGVPRYRLAGRRVVGVSPDLIRRLSAALRERVEGATVAQTGGRVIRGRLNRPGYAALVDTGSSFWETMWGMPILVRLMLVLFAVGLVYGRLRAMHARQIKEMSDPSAVLEKALGESPLLTAEAPAVPDRKAKRA